MLEREDEGKLLVVQVATRAIHDYAQGILTVEALAVQMYEDWLGRRKAGDRPSQNALFRIAQRICSRALCAAWRSAQPELRNCAFDNLRRYLRGSLRNAVLRELRNEQAVEDIVQQTLAEFHQSLARNHLAGPSDPDRFLRWAQVALFRHVHAYIQKCREDRCDSLEEKREEFAEQFIDWNNPDPQKYVADQELQQALKDAILLLRNPRYRQVLLYTFLEEMDVRDLAARLRVDVQEIYVWRRRALNALRKNQASLQLLQAWRE